MKTYRHMSSIILISWSCLTFSLSWAGDIYHTFTDVNGRNIKGQLMKLDAGSQVVTIKRADNKTSQAPLAVFSKVDQQYIREQDFVADFMRSVKVVTRLKKFDTGERSYGRRYKSDYLKSVGYTVALENHSNSEFKDVDVEYCMYYRQGERIRRRMVFSHGIQYGRWKIDALMPGARNILKTETVLIYDEECVSTLFGSTGGAKGEIQGIWLRFSIRIPDGDTIVREVHSPDKIGRVESWSTSSILAGLNNVKTNIKVCP